MIKPAWAVGLLLVIASACAGEAYAAVADRGQACAEDTLRIDDMIVAGNPAARLEAAALVSRAANWCMSADEEELATAQACLSVALDIDARAESIQEQP